MIPGMVTSFFAENQDLLWLLTLAIDLGFALLLYRVFGKTGLYASVILSILMANLQGPKLTIILGMQTSLGVILYSGIYFATPLAPTLRPPRGPPPRRVAHKRWGARL